MEAIRVLTFPRNWEILDLLWALRAIGSGN
jgi:hypothetical protein